MCVIATDLVTGCMTWTLALTTFFISPPIHPSNSTLLFWLHAFSHYPKLMVIGESWTVDRLVPPSSSQRSGGTLALLLMLHHSCLSISDLIPNLVTKIDENCQSIWTITVIHWTTPVVEALCCERQTPQKYFIWLIWQAVKLTCELLPPACTVACQAKITCVWTVGNNVIWRSCMAGGLTRANLWRSALTV